jgi:hypothetical protein
VPVDFFQIALEESPVPEAQSTAVAPYRIATEKLYIAATAGRIGPVPEHMRRDDEMRGVLGTPPALIETYNPDGELSEHCYLDDLTWMLTLAGFIGVATPGSTVGTNEVQTLTITGSPSGGTYLLVYDGQTTQPIAYNATAAAVQAALEALRNIGVGNVLCGGGPHPGTPVTVTFQAALGGRNVSQMTAISTGLTPSGTVTPTTTTPGVAGPVSDPDGGTVPTGATKWVFSKRDTILAQTARILANYATENMAFQGNGYAVDSLSLNAAGELQASLTGMVFQKLAVSSLTPTLTSLAVPPLRRGNLYVSWIAAGGPLSDFSFSIANSLERVRTMALDPPSSFSDRVEYGDEQVKLTGTIPKRILAAADVDALMAASTFAAKARWRTPKVIGATTYPYSIWIEMPAAQLLSGEFDALGNKRRFGGSYGFEAQYDETAGYDLRITVVNATPTIATYV